MTRPSARILQGTPRNLALLARVLREGDIVGVPTETVYGLAGNALDSKACAKIFRAKRRPARDPLIVHAHGLGDVENVCHLNDAARLLARTFWPGPLTLVLPKKPSIPDIVTSGRDSVAVRVPRHPLFRRLLKRAGVPLAAPSANPFGYISPTTAEHVRQGLGNAIEFILDGGPAHIGLESTIVDLRNPHRPVILRPGAITASAIEKVLRRPVIVAKRRAVRPQSRRQGEIAPGLLARHYSPRTPVTLHTTLPPITRAPAKTREAFVYLRRPPGKIPANIFWLDARGDLRGVARRLFATLRHLDALAFRRIHVELAPDEGLGHAINDRLTRAAAR